MSNKDLNTLVPRVWVSQGYFHCADGAGTYTREATSDEKLLWARVERLIALHDDVWDRSNYWQDRAERLDEAINLALLQTGGGGSAGEPTWHDILRVALIPAEGKTDV